MPLNSELMSHSWHSLSIALILKRRLPQPPPLHLKNIIDISIPNTASIKQTQRKIKMCVTEKKIHSCSHLHSETRYTCEEYEKEGVCPKHTTETSNLTTECDTCYIERWRREAEEEVAEWRRTAKRSGSESPWGREYLASRHENLLSGLSQARSWKFFLRYGDREQSLMSTQSVWVIFETHWQILWYISPINESSSSSSISQYHAHRPISGSIINTSIKTHTAYPKHPNLKLTFRRKRVDIDINVKKTEWDSTQQGWPEQGELSSLYSVLDLRKSSSPSSPLTVLS